MTEHGYCEANLSLAAFDFASRTRIVFGPGRSRDIGALAASLQATRVLVVTDKGIVAAGHVCKLRTRLESAGLHVTVFDDVEENPTDNCVARCVAEARKAGIDAFIAAGGGSSIDAAKGANFVLTGGGRIQDYWGWGKAPNPMLPLIAVPTTAGTGSECQSYALISDAQSHQKMACGDPKAAARIALLDPELTISQPSAVTACTGIDALAHALESAVTKRRNPVSKMFSAEAFNLLWRNLPRVLAEPQNIEARAAVQIGASFAGAAIENSMLGAAHSAANPLTARFGISHGQAVGSMLPHVVRVNCRDSDAFRIYRELRLAGEKSSPGLINEALPEAITYLLQKAGLKTRLSELEVPIEALPQLATEAASQWTARFNPIDLDSTGFLELYGAAF